MARPPIFCGLAMSTREATRTPQGRMASAMRAMLFEACPASRNGAALLTLLTLQPLMPTGGQQARVFGDRGEIVAHVAAVEEDAAAGVAAFDRAIGVVPLIDPADGHGGRFADVGFAAVSLPCARLREADAKAP